MKIVIPGGTGQVGQILARHFLADGHEVVILSRSAAPSAQGRVVQWDGASRGEWCAELEGVVNVCSPHPLPNREFMRT